MKFAECKLEDKFFHSSVELEVAPPRQAPLPSRLSFQLHVHNSMILLYLSLDSLNGDTVVSTENRMAGNREAYRRFVNSVAYARLPGTAHYQVSKQVSKKTWRAQFNSQPKCAAISTPEQKCFSSRLNCSNLMSVCLGWAGRLFHSFGRAAAKHLSA